MNITAALYSVPEPPPAAPAPTDDPDHLPVATGVGLPALPESDDGRPGVPPARRPRPRLVPADHEHPLWDVLSRAR